MKKVELLAPAKDKQTAFAAINSGCDALYIGAQSFGARKKVGNSLEDIKEIVDYAHKFYVKVHVTLNTILTDDELKEAQKLIHQLYEIGVDAIIVQDMGILKLAIEGKLPPIPIHASTQCDNRTVEKAKFFKEIGLSRVILARELSLEQIKEICNILSPLREAPVKSGEGRILNELVSCKNSVEECEVETFIHGALCVSYSGQCYLSHYIGGRSANRGECAQACRKKYSLIDENGNIIAKDKYLLSLKDFNASKHLKKLIDIGVKSFKIEGRLKDENYVKNVVAFYRQEIDKFAQKTSSGKIFLDFEPDVRKSFNRDFTDYYLTLTRHSVTPSPRGRGYEVYNFDSPKSMGEYIGKITKVGKDWFEIGRQEDKKAGGQVNLKINPQDGLYFNGQGCLVNKIENTVQNSLSSGRDGGLFVKIYPNKMDGIKVGIDIYRNFNAEFEKQLKNSKTKRQIAVKLISDGKTLKAIDEDKNTVQINLPDGELPKNPQKMKETFIKQLQKTGDSDFYIENTEINSELPFLPVSQINELRRTILSKLMEERLKNYPREFQKPLKYTNFPEEKMDYRANVHNKTAKEFYSKCNCEICEMSFESQNFFTASGPPLFNKRDKELMRTKHCLKYAFNMCQSPKKLYLVDEKGVKYPLKFDCKNCEMIILS